MIRGVLLIHTIVDDDKKLRNLLSEFLMNNNFIVSSASNANDANYLMQSIVFDLVVLDIMMPGKSGIQF